LFDETQLHKTVNTLAAAAIPPISLARVQRAGGFERGPEPRVWRVDPRPVPG